MDANAMFKLTKKEQMIVALLVAVLVIGSVVRNWRDRQSPPTPATSSNGVQPTR
jgi:hypothetical protein